MTKRKLALVLTVLISVAFSACAKMNATRKLEFTVFPPPNVTVTDQVKKITLGVRPLRTEDADISGGHHEGLLQVRQPWIWGLSSEQKKTLYGDLGATVRYAFIDEFLRRGLKVKILEGEDAGKADFIVSGAVKAITLNTYGQGTVEGFGSAGDYWEAEVLLVDVNIYNARKGFAAWRGELKEYAKLPNCPAKLDWTMFTVISKSLEQGVAMSQASTPFKAARALFKSVDNSRADYRLEVKEKTPVEIAARLAALKVIETLNARVH